MEQTSIGFVGIESPDIALYLARFYSATGKRVAILDCSELKSLLRLISFDGTIPDETSYYKNILVLNVDVECASEIENQDIVIYYFGYNFYAEEIQECTEIVYVTDMSVSGIQILNEVQVPDDVNEYLIFYNYSSVKYGEKYLLKMFERSLDEEHIFYLPYDEADYKAMCYLCVDKKHRLSALSSAMKKVILEMYLLISGSTMKRKEQLAILKQA